MGEVPVFIYAAAVPMQTRQGQACDLVDGGEGLMLERVGLKVPCRLACSIYSININRSPQYFVVIEG